DPQICLMAATLGAQINDPLERIQAVVGYLQSHHKYSLHTKRGAGDPVSSFLLEGRAAHCEYFASAAAILLRCMNVPTRYVIGYYAHESDGDDLTTVRLRDAHAWAESWIDGQGWTTVEATPASGIPNETTKLSTTQKWREQLQNRVMSLRHWLTGLVARLQTNSRVFLWFTGVFFLLIPTVFFWWKRRSSSTQLRPYQTPDVELAVLIARFEKRMKRRGVVCSASQMWREQLQPLEERERVSALQFLDCYGRARFGAAKNCAAVDEAWRLLQTLETSANCSTNRDINEPRTKSAD
ncbi:MAG TPA: transglutaminase-like domain-containing protein, partial [Abditibacteriaceae bacterium]|nr:transglutaminase-like domain-containing protein [Abditibacteriaceae bacterium]